MPVPRRGKLTDAMGLRLDREQCVRFQSISEERE